MEKLYSRDQIDQVRSAVDIVEVIREYVPSLKIAGRSVKGLCPFHSERTPSFHVHPEKGIFKCFGCGEGGDAIGFISKIEQVGFSEALEKLADQAGVRLQKQDHDQRREPEGIKEKLHRVLASASRMYEDLLWDEKAGRSGREYLKKRGITDETTQFFHLGIAPSTGSGIFEALVKKGYPIELCQQAGLVSRSSAGRFYDPLFGRLIFPIFDSFGHVIGFGGRTLPQGKETLLGSGADSVKDEGPKYLNSPETPVFSKGKSLFGIREAKANLLESHKAIVFEGYMDVIGVRQGGVQNVVATLGTAFTKDHARLLKRYGVDTAYAFFDPDEAGRRAALRSLEPLLHEDIYPRIVSGIGEKDPDEIILEMGKETFETLISKASDFVDSLIDSAFHLGAPDLQKRAELGKQLTALIAQSPNEILRGEWSRRVADRLGLALSSLNQELKRQSSVVLKASSTETKVARPNSLATMSSAEEEFLELLMAEPSLWPDVDLAVNDFSDNKHQRLFELLKEQMKSTGKVSVPRLYEDMPVEYKDWLMKISLGDKEFGDPRERVQQLIRDIRLKRSREKLGQLKNLVAAGRADQGQQEEYKELLKKIKGSNGVSS